eukprot:1718527-Amphidinium_carterae.1
MPACLVVARQSTVEAFLHSCAVRCARQRCNDEASESFGSYTCPADKLPQRQGSRTESCGISSSNEGEATLWPHIALQSLQVSSQVQTTPFRSASGSSLCPAYRPGQRALVDNSF